MKINGPNQSNFNPYKNIIQKQAEMKKDIKKEDKIEISAAAKQLQETDQPNKTRVAYVQKIKEAVDSGEYKVDPQRTAKKMIDFWSKK